ncbi:MAG: hypothetical protein KDA41_09870 [Planctomycetales bacterium]|nr:hypothetical protein [Planctomycetales bacterium]
MRSVWKFEHAETPAAFDVEMPDGAHVIDVAVLGSERGHALVTIWALVDTDAKPVARTFQIFGTGRELPATPVGHVATWREGPFVWHLFELFGTDLPDDLAPERHADWRLLLEQGFTPVKRDEAHKACWLAPDDEPVGMDTYQAIARLQEHGYGPIVK